jgi:hypothetical protein
MARKKAVEHRPVKKRPVKKGKADPLAVPFRKLNTATSQLAKEGRAPSAALLVWFLQHVMRLEEDEAIDCVCDGPGDKGIDGIWVDSVGEQITILQAKRRESLGSTQGDVEIQRLIGAAGWFTSPERLDSLLAAAPNPELTGLVSRNEIHRLLREGYSVRCVFVTNGKFDRAGQNYTDAHADGPPSLDGWDLTRLEPYIRYADRSLCVDETVTLYFADGENGQAVFRLQQPNALQVTFGAVTAKQLANLPGISDKSLFAQNVRFDLGRTRVNKDINATLRDASEHPRFITFHNGLTILCQKIIEDDDESTVTISGFSVVNGCQSVVSFYNNQKFLTDDLLVPVRLVDVGGHRTLADDITYRSNNQNAINLKDLRANDTTQVTLKGEFTDLFKGRVDYEIKRGETSTASIVIPNDLAGQILLALYNQEPWLSHRKFDIFDARYKDVFHPSIGAPHIFAGYLIYDEVRKKLPKVENRLMANYGLTTFVLVYLVGLLMRDSEEGTRLLDDPLKIVRDTESKFRHAVARLIDDILIDVNAYVEEQETENGYFDYKTSFKSQTAVTALAGDVHRQHKRAVLRSDEVAFHLDA